MAVYTLAIVYTQTAKARTTANVYMRCVHNGVTTSGTALMCTCVVYA
ncbi:MAG: hypothetical protein IPK82_01835 [Polyangiaceae bacterium]|nr:hypothetical protein [Polyangiaceae bacterium]